MSSKKKIYDTIGWVCLALSFVLLLMQSVGPSTIAFVIGFSLVVGGARDYYKEIEKNNESKD